MQTLYDANGKEGTPRQIDRLVANLDLKDIPETAGHPLRPGHAPRRPAHVPEPPARVQCAGQHRHRPFPGKRAVSGHAGGHRPSQPRQGMVVRGEQHLCRLGRARRRGRRQQAAGLRLCRQDALSRGHRRDGAHRIHPRAAAGLRTAARHGRARALAAGLASRPGGQRPASLRRIRGRVAGARQGWRPGPGAGAGLRGRRTWPPTTCR